MEIVAKVSYVLSEPTKQETTLSSKIIKALKINAESSLSYLPAIPNFLATP